MSFQNLCLLGSLILLLLFTFTGESHSETETWTLTGDERALIDEVHQAGVLDEAGWARFFERVKYSPRREGAIHKALNDESIGSRLNATSIGYLSMYLIQITRSITSPNMDSGAY